MDVSTHLELNENILSASYDVSMIASVRKGAESSNTGFVAHPERNLVLVSLAYGFAAGLNSPTIYMGCNADDGGSDMPDTRPSFFAELTAILQLLKPQGKVELPFIDWPKSRIVRWAYEHKDLGPDFLRYTRSCWQDTPAACGQCKACRIRMQAFEDANVQDPTVYMAS